MSNLEMMEEILTFRKADNTFQKSIDQRSENMSFRFFDGPPFASGTPHYGHLLAGAIKDVIPRYMTMRGYRVERKRGRDCHGLPVEKAVEKELGIDGKRDIETKIGIETFVEKCRNYVQSTNDSWKWFIDHTARWADIENDYRTMDLDFMESVMYCFSKIYRDNLVYRGFKVQRYCPSCATPLANNEVSEGYEDKQDNAITVKFQVKPTELQLKLGEKYETNPDKTLKYVRGVIKNDKGEILQMFSEVHHQFTSPGGKVEKGETLEEALKREIREEIGVETTKTIYLGSFKEFYANVGFLEQSMFEVEVDGEPQNIEKDKHSQFLRVKVEPAETELGFQLVLENNIITDEEEIRNQFPDLYYYLKEIPSRVSQNCHCEVSETSRGNPENIDNGLLRSARNDSTGKIYFLARTTTPRTLPSNMFLATGENIDYAFVYDFASQEYYILASNLIKKYYKNPEDYLVIRVFKGKELKGLYYEPLFDYISKSFTASVIANEMKQSINTDDQDWFASSQAPRNDDYLSQFFQVLNADYVSTEDGTGIVHIAPTFGEEDYNVVAKLLGGENALDWLFMPVNEYGEFDDQVYDYTGELVLTINKTIIQRLKDEGKLVKSESITHSYPHCWRCHSPLISKAMSSRFIKEQQMNAETWKDAENINFIPASVKNRFINGLQQAPDWNIARNRYWGSPLPIWQNVDDENDHFSVGSLEELYQLSLSGSKNLEKREIEGGKILYWDIDRNAEIDLHKPYIDNYWFVVDGKTYRRVPEVMDCRFESGAMPFGQEHYLG